MYQSIEAVLLSEFLVDLAAIWAALYPKNRVRISRLMFAALVGASASAMAALLSPTCAVSAIIGIAIMPLLIYICIGQRSCTETAGSIASMLAVSALISACSHSAGACTFYARICSAFAASAAAAALLSLQRRWLDSWETTIRISDGDSVVSFPALIDTGNRLTEPISALPVIIVESSLIKNLIPCNINTSTSLPRGFRLIAYGGVGGNGMLPCFMPRSITSNGKKIRDIWVAIYPGRLPGKYRALAPAAIISQINKNQKRRTIKCQAQDP